MTYYDIEGTILEKGPDIDKPAIGSIIDLGMTFSPQYYLVVSHIYYPHYGFAGVIIDPIDPFLDGKLSDFRISGWAHEIYQKKMERMSKEYNLFNPNMFERIK